MPGIEARATICNSSAIMLFLFCFVFELHQWCSGATFGSVLLLIGGTQGTV